MYCPRCSRPNPPDADKCECGQATHYFRERVFIWRQFIFVQADQAHPIALKVDDAVQTFHAPAILSRYQHAVSFGDELPEVKPSVRDARVSPQARKRLTIAPLPDQNKLPLPSLNLL